MNNSKANANEKLKYNDANVRSF